MNNITCLIILALLLGTGCAPKGEKLSPRGNRYDGINKQTSFVSLSYPLDTEELIGKTRNQIKDLFGDPVRVQKNPIGALSELWIYYPQDTNNVIAILIGFDGEKVKECSYEPVM